MAVASDALRDKLRVYIIADREAVGRSGMVEGARAALEGGGTCLQYRAKNVPIRTMLSEGKEMLNVARQYGVPFLVNDRVDVAAALAADGVHLGADDMPLSCARRVLGSAAIIGATAKTAQDARRLESGGADYLGVGPVYRSATKPDAGRVLGPQGLAGIIGRVRLPVVGIGGIEPDNARAIIRAGAAGVAVVSCVMGDDDPQCAAQRLTESLEGSSA